MVMNLLLLALPGALLGTISGLLACRWLLARRKEDASPLPDADPFVSAELDQAAAQWATANGQPEAAAGLMADKLHLLYALGRRRQS